MGKITASKPPCGGNVLNAQRFPRRLYPSHFHRFKLLQIRLAFDLPMQSEAVDGCNRTAKNPASGVSVPISPLDLVEESSHEVPTTFLVDT